MATAGGGDEVVFLFSSKPAPVPGPDSHHGFCNFQREALRGVAERVLDHIFDCSTSRQVAKLLQAPLERAAVADRLKSALRRAKSAIP